MKTEDVDQEISEREAFCEQHRDSPLFVAERSRCAQTGGSAHAARFRVPCYSSPIILNTNTNSLNAIKAQIATATATAIS